MMNNYILSKSSKEIKNLDKYLFSDKELSGRVLLYENLGKMLGYQQYNDDGFYGDILSYQKMIKELGHDEGYEFHTNRNYAKEVYEGRGLIVAELEIGAVANISTYDAIISKGTLYSPPTVDLHNSNGDFIKTLFLQDLENQGYTNQKYAYEIKSLTTLPKPRRLDEFVNYNKRKKLLNKGFLKCTLIETCIDMKINKYHDCTSCNQMYRDNDLYVSKVNGIVRVIDTREVKV